MNCLESERARWWDREKNREGLQDDGHNHIEIFMTRTIRNRRKEKKAKDQRTDGRNVVGQGKDERRTVKW